MGSDQSTGKSREEPKLSQNDVEKLLASQRKMYEAKCQQYIEKASTESAQKAVKNNQTQQATPMYSTPKHTMPMQHAMPVQHSMPMQHPMPMQQSMPIQHPMPMQQSMPIQRPTSMQQSMPMQQTAQTPRSVFQPNAVQPNLSIDRQRRPYSYGRSDLQNIRESVTSPPNLYPNLNNHGPSRSSGHTHVFDFHSNNNNATTSAQDFVVVNRNGQVDRPQPSASAPSRTGDRDGSISRPQPSAPTPRRTGDRDRSISRSRNNHVNDGFKCFACKEMFGIQIFQCSSGHSLCNKCKDSCRPCGNCGNIATNTRNFDLEKLVADIKVPCPHNNEGCRLFIKNSEMDTHIKECPFKILNCPIAGCFWNGKLKQLSAHFDTTHCGRNKADVDSEMQLQNISRNSQNTYLVLIGAFNFLFHVKVSDRNVYMTAQLIGTKTSASKWTYEVHVYNKSESRRKYTFSDVCSSNVETVSQLYKNGRCTVLPPTYASTFVNNDTINYKFFIKKAIESKPKGDFKKNQRANDK